jgi:glycosyltransferase involved in cell wall biosynthesis
VFALPSVDEAFGVAYVEAMAAGVPAIGCRGEPGPEEIAAAGDGFLLVPPGDIERLTQRIDELLSDPQRLREAGQRARATVAAHFTWERCGEETVSAYEQALR